MATAAAHIPSGGAMTALPVKPLLEHNARYGSITKRKAKMLNTAEVSEPWRAIIPSDIGYISTGCCLLGRNLFIGRESGSDGKWENGLVLSFLFSFS